MAERVNTRTVALTARLQRVPTAGWLIVLIAGALLTAILVLLFVTPKKATISTQLLGFPDGSTTTQFVVRYRIDKPSHADVTCTVQAVGKDHDLVGSVDDTTPARGDTTRTSTRQIAIPTTKQAVTASILDCHIVARH